MNGEPGNILGAGVFDVGSFENKKLVCSEVLLGDSTYYVKLLKDDGDRILTTHKDLPIKDSVIKKDLITTFKTTSGIPVNLLPPANCR